MKRLIVVWALSSLLLILSAPAFGYSAAALNLLSPDAHYGHHKPDNAGERSLNVSARNGTDVPFALYQLATSTAVTSPTATVVSPTPADTQMPTATLGAEGAPATATQPADATAPPIDVSASLTPTTERGQTGSASAAPAGEPTTVNVPAAPATQPAVSIQEVATATAVLESGMKDPTTYTARVAVPSGSLLDRLTHNKPGIWGNKAFYVGLAAVYIVLLGLLFRILFQMARRSD